MLIDNFNRTIDLWISELEKYNLDQLLIKPDSASWSLGQVYTHLIEETRWYMEQVELCLKSNENSSEKMIEGAKATFANNEFADQRIKGDPFVSENVKQPAGKFQLQKDMLDLKSDMNALWNKVSESNGTGKARHPGLGYFNAIEWIQYADMHMRHHLKQKKRLGDALKITE